MCVIICKPADKVISEHDIKNAHRVNSDGFGYMYYDPIEDDIVAHKGVFTKDTTIVKMIQPLQDKEICLHFRIKTHGEISNTACHPFRVTDKDKHGMTVYVMHNGTIHGMVGKPTESDTQIFVNKYLHKLLKADPMLIEEPEFQDLIEAKIGRGNRLCFMYGKGKILRMNETLWDTHEGMRCSNKHFVYRAPVETPAERWAKEMGDASETMDAYCGPYRGSHSHNAYTDPRAPLLCGHPVAVKDALFITNKDDDAFYAEGEVTHINPFSILVKFKDAQQKDVIQSFFLISGESVGHQYDYQCIPMNRKVMDSEMTISGLVGPTEENTRPDGLPEGTKGDLLTPALLQLTAPDLNEEFKKKELVNLETSQPETKKAVVNSCNVYAAGTTVNANARWGGYHLGRFDQKWTTDTTILEFYDMSPQERFSHFMEHPEECFNMWQDFVDKTIYDNIDDGLLEMEGDVVFEVADKDPEEEEGERIDAMLAAAGMYH
jgi:hypothetical protein